MKNEFDYGDIAYLDSGATSQMPISVREKINDFEKNTRANVHRGSYTRAANATHEYEDARSKIAKFINADTDEIIFTSGTTDSINVLADITFNECQYGGVIISELEHHANIVPWQLKGYTPNAPYRTLQVLPIDDTGTIIYNELEDFILNKIENKNNDATPIVSVAHVSNTLGTIQPIKQIIEIAHRHGVWVHLDGAQAVGHLPVDVKELDVDFYSFSGHKMYGPTGIGVLYGKKELLNNLIPVRGGGDMIDKVSFEKTTFNDIPWKFEAGTPNITGAVGLGYAAEWLGDKNWDDVISHEEIIYRYLQTKLKELDWVHIVCEEHHDDKIGTASLIFDGLHTSDVAAILDTVGVCCRDGQHCTQPLMDKLGISGTLRVSIGLYNTTNDIDRLILGLNKARKMLA